MLLFLFSIEDNEVVSILHLVNLASDFIHQGRCHGNVLVHCVAGVSRSASFCIAYLMRELGVTFEEGLQMVRKARPVCWPNAGFAQQLRYNFQKKIIIFSLGNQPFSFLQNEVLVVTFSVHYETKWGQKIHLVGDSDILGNWKPTPGNEMKLDNNIIFPHSQIDGRKVGCGIFNFLCLAKNSSTNMLSFQGLLKKTGICNFFNLFTFLSASDSLVTPEVTLEWEQCKNRDYDGRRVVRDHWGMPFVVGDNF